MGPTASQAFCVFGARAVLKSLGFLAKHMQGARRGRSVQSVHRMRVAARRLGSALAPFEGCFAARRLAGWNREIRLARRALGHARDADVQIEFLAGFLKDVRAARPRRGIELLLVRLRRRRRKLQKDVVAALDRLQERGVLDGFREAASDILRRGPARGARGASATLRQRAAKQARAHLRALLALEPCVRRPARIEDHHAMRIAAKRLRYIMELYRSVYGDALAPAIKAARGVQGRLGEIHDCDVWVAWLPRFLHKERRRTIKHFGDARPLRQIEPGIRYLRENRRRRRAKKFREFAAFWAKLRRKRVWEQLEDALRGKID